MPELEFDATDGVRVYVDRTDKQSTDSPDGTVAIKQFSLSIVSTRPGPVTLPALEVTWWDTQTDTQKTATLAAESFDVEGDASLAAESGNATAATPTDKAAIAPQNEAKLSLTNTVWLWASAALGAMLVAALALFVARRRRRTLQHSNALPAAAGTPLPPAVASAELTNLERTLRKACNAGDAQLAYGSLQRWLAINQNHTATTRAGGNERPVALDACLAELEQILYSDQSVEHWQGNELLMAFDTFKSRKATNNKGRRQAGSIPPLYPLETV